MVRLKSRFVNAVSVPAKPPYSCTLFTSKKVLSRFALLPKLLSAGLYIGLYVPPATHICKGVVVVHWVWFCFAHFNASANSGMALAHEEPVPVPVAPFFTYKILLVGDCAVRLIVNRVNTIKSKNLFI